ncbi:MAG: putative DNA binding domain-containing protein [Candidatus Yanofskybacteria bacterium]|nr:putative DNA binding domain-containing protein [Candidatus Yanofskybacteria bacterium]
MIVKKSPVVIVKNFILLQIGAIVVFFIVSALANYAAIYRSLIISHTVSFRIAEALFIFLAETAMVLFIFFRWYKEYYQIRDGEIIHAYGVLYHQRTKIPLDSIISINYRQSPLGKLTKYGTLELTGSNTNKKIQLKNVPNPEECVDLIFKFKKLSGDQNIKTAASSSTPLNISDLLNKNEHENLEFKSTFRWDMRQNAVNRILEKSAMKTIAAFLNSQGGQLVIGVDDKKAIVGLTADFGSLVKKDADGFENHFTQVFHNMIGAEFRQFVKLNWSQVDGKECCIVSVSPSHKPVYLKSDNRDEEFYIRTGNGTTALKLSEANAYIDSRRNRF